MDSGYSSTSPGPASGGGGGGFLAPHPDWVLSRTYEGWKIADAATQRLLVDLRALEDARARLRAARKRREVLLRRCVPPVLRLSLLFFACLCGGGVEAGSCAVG